MFMNRKNIIQNFRTNGLLKGRRPAVVNIFKNYGGYKNEGGYFVLTIKDDNTLSFQAFTRFLHNIDVNRDFLIKPEEITSFAISYTNKYMGCFAIYLTQRRFIPCYFAANTMDAYESVTGIKYIASKLEDCGKKDLSNNPLEEEEEPKNE